MIVADIADIVPDVGRPGTERMSGQGTAPRALEAAFARVLLRPPARCRVEPAVFGPRPDEGRFVAFSQAALRRQPMRDGPSHPRWEEQAGQKYFPEQRDVQRN